jgi:hypothetical protein
MVLQTLRHTFGTLADHKVGDDDALLVGDLVQLFAGLPGPVKDLLPTSRAAVQHAMDSSLELQGAANPPGRVALRVKGGSGRRAVVAYTFPQLITFLWSVLARLLDSYLAIATSQGLATTAAQKVSGHCIRKRVLCLAGQTHSGVKPLAEPLVLLLQGFQ